MTSSSDKPPGRDRAREDRAAASPRGAPSSALRAIVSILARQAAREAFAESKRDAVVDGSTL